MGNFGKYTVFRGELGWMGLVSTRKGVYASVLPQKTEEEARSKILARLPFEPEYDPGAFAAMETGLQAYFRGGGPVPVCEIDWSWATPFQKNVLGTVRNIPAGVVLTYGEVACLSGSPGAARAVGGALAANRIPIIIPCHRVIRSNGTLGGFTGAGLEVKARLLFLEGVKKETRDSSSPVSCVYSF